MAALVSSGLQASLLEQAMGGHPELKAKMVWVAVDPKGVLAALDHDPQVFLLDMRWRSQALDAARLLHQFGVPLMVALVDRLDDPLIPDLRTLGVEVYMWGSPMHHLMRRIGVAG